MEYTLQKLQNEAGLRYSKIILASDNQPWFNVSTPFYCDLVFESLSVSTNPQTITLKSPYGTLSLNGILKIEKDNDKHGPYDVFYVQSNYCNRKVDYVIIAA